MITVQIASQLTAQGVEGVRWVLIEADDAAAADAPPPAAALIAEAPAAASSGRLIGLKALVVLAGLGAALVLARIEYGAPTLRWLAPLKPAAITPAPARQPAAPASRPVLVAGANP